MKAFIFILTSSLLCYCAWSITIPFLLGHSACQTFPCSYMGKAYFGMQAAFLERYDAGDEPLISVDLISWDDKYNNTLTKEHTRTLFSDVGISGMVGVFGAQPSNDSKVVTIERNGIFFPSLSGANSLRTPFTEDVINLRPSYYDEIQSVGRYAVSNLGCKYGALLRQSDTFGFDANSMFEIVAKDLDFTITTSSTYNKIELDVSGAVDEIMSTNPDFVIIAAQLPAAVSFIRLAKEKYPNVTSMFFCLSSVDTFELWHALESVSVSSEDVMSAMILPSFLNDSLPLATEFRKSLNQYFPGELATSFSWEGYVIARFVVSILEDSFKQYANIAKESLLNTIFRDKQTWNISGLKIGPFTEETCNSDIGLCSCNQGLHTVYIMKMVNGILTEVEDSRWDFSTCGTVSSSSNKALLAIITSIVGVVILIAVITIIVTSVVCKKVKEKKQSEPQYIHLNSISEVSEIPRPPNPFYEACAKEVMTTTHFISNIEKEELNDMSLIGVGSSAKVYRATWRGTFVAVKQLHYQLDMCMDTMVSELANEIKLWSQLMHPYIVQFLGVTKELWLVMEYMEGGPLRSYIKNEHLSMRSKLILLQHAALALEYIHSLKIVHRDFNPNNIMITGPKEHLEAKLADFGLSRTELNSSMKQTLSVGTPVYAAPEVLAHGQFSTKSDVYSFGLTLWFIQTEEDPLADIKNQFELVRQVVMDQKRPLIAKCTILQDLIEWCWHTDPNERPSFDVITFTIHQYLRKTSSGSPERNSLAIPSLSRPQSYSSSRDNSRSNSPALSSSLTSASNSFVDVSDALPSSAPRVNSVLDNQPQKRT